jgi:type I restriction-modification system DNA methylase subunit
MRNNMDPSEYKHVILGLIFLKYISDSFEETYHKIKITPNHSMANGKTRTLTKQRMCFGYHQPPAGIFSKITPRSRR